MKNATLQEMTSDALSEARVDPESGMIFGVKICGRESANGRIYLKPAFCESTGLYEGKALKKGGHGKKGSAPGFEETIGVLRNVRAKNSGLFADVDVVDDGPDGRKLLALAERAPGLFGASQEASGKIERGGPGEHDKVREITAVRAVALVGNPATTQGLFENDRAAAELIESLASHGDAGQDRRLRELEIREAAREKLGSEFVEAEGSDAVFRRAAKCGVSPEEFVEDWRNVLDASGGISASSTERDPDSLFDGPRDQFSSRNGDDRDAEPGYGADDIFGEDGPNPRDLFA